MYKEEYESAYSNMHKREIVGTRKKQMILEKKQAHYDIIGWLLRQNEYAKCSERYRLSYELRAGEIYEVDFGINVNAEFSYRHYALVLVDSTEANPLVLVCPLKSNTKGAHPASDISLGIIESLDTDHESLALVNQIRTIDKFRIFKRQGIGKKEECQNKLNDSGSNYTGDMIDDTIIPNRLEPELFKLVLSGVLNYLKYGVVSPKWWYELVVF